ncbi:hypothetical protein SR1949_18440 [Sphaerospermopsis reniformis]|jgi:hypothetical protein|uniref:Uncharacterized protein n=1 Tax=Sphaerospermopsis reniformis TaxID=531300 RepID=A0A479ZZP0_9CYAN|nr:hypothetical protein SR1949_18440 [Sphaerospermopsis reniformis]
MNEIRSNFRLLECYSASTQSTSFQKHYLSVTDYKIVTVLAFSQSVVSTTTTTMFIV